MEDLDIFDSSIHIPMVCTQFYIVLEADEILKYSVHKTLKTGMVGSATLSQDEQRKFVFDLYFTKTDMEIESLFLYANKQRVAAYYNF